MSQRNLQRTAYTVECFLNALELADGPERTRIEDALVRWLSDGRRGRQDHLIYRDGRIDCFSDNRVEQGFDVPHANRAHTIWCDGSKLSIIDTTAFARDARLVMLGTAGLSLHVSGRNWEVGVGWNSNNNNNNNNG